LVAGGFGYDNAKSKVQINGRWIHSFARLFANEVELRSSEAQNPSADVPADAESERSELQEVPIMKLENKKQLASRVFNVGKSRIVFNTSRLSEIKEAITKQDMKDLKEAGAIIIKEKKGRKKIEKRKTRRRAGSIKKKVNKRKQNYVKLTRKLRKHLKNLKQKNNISSKDYKELRKEIRTSAFRSLNQMKERMKETKK